MRKSVRDQIWDALNNNKLEPEQAIWATLAVVQDYTRGHDKRFEECLANVLRHRGYHVEKQAS